MYWLSFLYLTVEFLAIVSFKHGNFAENNIPVSSNNSERMITNLDIIYNSSGVPLDRSYNESISNGFTSSPGCPKSIDGIPWIYYGDPPRCFLAAQQGPCPKEQKLLLVKASPFGVCACECVVDGEFKPSSKSNDQIKPRYMSCHSKRLMETSNGQIFDTKAFKCFDTGTQGPCDEGKILVGHKYFELECLPQCIGEEYAFFNDNYMPIFLNGTKCQMFDDDDDAYNAPSSVQENKCPAAEKYSETLKKCIKEEIFFFSCRK